jgi:hypothetical protein
MTAIAPACNLTIALNYGGRDEVARATKRLARTWPTASWRPRTWMRKRCRDTSIPCVLPDPDLVIRTSGEARISNFLLWQSAYAEYEFIDTLWPDFTADELWPLCAAYGERDRRFGAVRREARRPRGSDLGAGWHRRFVMATLGLAAVWLGGLVFIWFVSALAGLMVWELARLLAPPDALTGGASGAVLSALCGVMAIYFPAGLALPTLLVPIRGRGPMQATARIYVPFVTLHSAAAFGMMSAA